MEAGSGAADWKALVPFAAPVLAATVYPENKLLKRRPKPCGFIRPVAA
jgi:hypothetical protein